MVEEETLNKLKTMLSVPLERVEETEEGLVVYVKKDQIAKAIGSGGSVVRAAEMVLGKKLLIKET